MSANVDHLMGGFVFIKKAPIRTGPVYCGPACIYQTMIVTINTVLAQMDQERLELNVRQMDLIDVPVVIPATTCLLLIIINVE